MIGRVSGFGLIACLPFVGAFDLGFDTLSSLVEMTGTLFEVILDSGARLIFAGRGEAGSIGGVCRECDIGEKSEWTLMICYLKSQLSHRKALLVAHGSLAAICSHLLDSSAEVSHALRCDTYLPSLLIAEISRVNIGVEP
jgi:hypothetical protein